MRSPFVRRKGDEPQRLFRFLSRLDKAARDYLAKKTPGRNHKSKGVRLRPELWDVIDTLCDRYEANKGVRLSPAEVIAAALQEAMSGLTAKDFSLPRAKIGPLDGSEQ